MKITLLLSALAAFSSAAVLQTPHQLKGWSYMGPAPKDRQIQVRFSLKKDTRLLDEVFATVTNPKSQYYRDWPTMQEEQRLVKVADAAPVKRWLSAAGVQSTVEGDSVMASLSVEQAESLFNTKVGMFNMDGFNRQWHAANVLHAPEDVIAVTAGVYGLHDTPLPPKKNRHVHNKEDGSYPEHAYPIAPADLRKRYDVPNGTRGDMDVKVRQAVAEFQGQWMTESDLQKFFREYVKDAKPGDDKVYSYHGNNQSGYGLEAELDIQYIMGVAPGILTEFWGLANFDFCSDLKNWLQMILKDENPPLVFSVSYGYQGDIPTFCSNYMDVDTDFKRVSMRGITIIFASGDSGSGYDGTDIWPSWPAVSPYVTSVGSTCFTDMTFTNEESTLQFGSGGGFSAVTALGDWQKTHVMEYVTKYAAEMPPDHLWKTFDHGKIGRATPDVSALGEGFQVVQLGTTVIVGGTSAATPTFSAIISLINNELHKKGKKPLGFLPSFLYKNADGFHDVTIGSNKIDRSGFPVPYGFDAEPGWDAASGLGTPKYSTLLERAMRN